MRIRSVEWPHYHIWTDALRGRDLAKEAKDRWDRGMFVRWSVMSAWTVFEEDVRTVLQVTYRGSRFWDQFDTSLRALGLNPPSRGQGLWQRMKKVYQERKKYAHLAVAKQEDLLLADSRPAEEAIVTIRDAVKSLHSLLSIVPPVWIDDDILPRRPRDGATACLTVGQGVADPTDPDVIRISYLYEDKESTPYLLPPATDPEPYMEDVIRTILIPISRVRAYRGEVILSEIRVIMRGSS